LARPQACKRKSRLERRATAPGPEAATGLADNPPACAAGLGNTGHDQSRLSARLHLVQASTALDRRWYELWTSPSPLLFSAGDLAAASRYRVQPAAPTGLPAPSSPIGHPAQKHGLQRGAARTGACRSAPLRRQISGWRPKSRGPAYGELRAPGGSPAGARPDRVCPGSSHLAPERHVAPVAATQRRADPSRWPPKVWNSYKSPPDRRRRSA
jgi:hypothetical protein